MTRILQLAPEATDLADAIAEYLAYKRKRLTASSFRGTTDTLKFFQRDFPNLTLAELEPPAGTRLVEGFLDQRWSERAGSTYNKHLGVLRNLCQWLLARDRLHRDPTLAIEAAREPEVKHEWFTDEERARILAVNHQPREQIALRLLLDYGLRKGSLADVRLNSFDEQAHEVSFWMKGDRYHSVTIATSDPIWRFRRQILETEPDHHYVLFRQVLRKRRTPDREQIMRAAALMEATHKQLAEITDELCTFEIARSAESIEIGAAWLQLAAWASSQRVVREYRDEPMGEHAMHDWWYERLARAGVVPRGITHGQRIHKARHTAAQRILDATGSITSAQDLLGHLKLATTEGYAKASRKQVRADVERTVPDELMDEALRNKAAATLRLHNQETLA